MSWSTDLVRRNEDGHRFVVLNDDTSGDSLMFDMSDNRGKLIVECTFGQFNEPDWSYIPFEEATQEEKAHLELLKEKHYWADWIESKLECNTFIK